ncbi:YjhX family toxin [Tropicibacter sp. R16_0]|uniref:YjhX family toxin n=1 Tax=Tropicibacter sp. R16_0 TaxID=2821102 RepID=UPI001ADBCE78|nr:YjhX family toxin [Tropicibacter sp. R16_0]MBO9449305.1 YjhX family toxin [Tropicibacter sp. R16_0]
MNISKHEQRVLHELALGGSIHFERLASGKIHDVTCYTRNGHVLSDCTLNVFQRLLKRRFIRSKNGGPYRASALGIKSVRAQMNQR